MKVFVACVLFFGSFTASQDVGNLCELPPEGCHTGALVQQLTSPFGITEGPIYDEDEHLVYFVDIHNGLVVRFDPNNHLFTYLRMKGDVSAVFKTRSKNGYIIANDRSLIYVQWNGTNTELSDDMMKVLVTVDQDKPGNRFNDGKVDPMGRLWMGTMGFENESGVEPNQGTLYSITGENMDIAIPQINRVTISNGLAFTRDNKTMYYIDTPTRRVAQYEYDMETGSIKYNRTALDLNDYPEIGGNPDGMTIDINGHLFVALFNGGMVIKVDPETGRILYKIAIPAREVTSVAWGGKNFDVLYVTTGRFFSTAEEQKQLPAAGSLFAIFNVGSRGYPANKVAFDDSLLAADFQL